jgi:hypothetical protein
LKLWIENNYLCYFNVAVNRPVKQHQCSFLRMSSIENGTHPVVTGDGQNEYYIPVITGYGKYAKVGIRYNPVFKLVSKKNETETPLSGDNKIMETRIKVEKEEDCWSSHGSSSSIEGQPSCQDQRQGVPTKEIQKGRGRKTNQELLSALRESYARFDWSQWDQQFGDMLEAKQAADLQGGLWTNEVESMVIDEQQIEW